MTGSVLHRFFVISIRSSRKPGSPTNANANTSCSSPLCWKTKRAGLSVDKPARVLCFDFGSVC